MIVGQRNGVDMNAVALDPVKRPLRRRRGGDAGDEPEAGAGEIRHAGGAVIDDGQPSAIEGEIAQGGETGVGRGEHVDLGGLAYLAEPGMPRAVVEFVVRETPAGECAGIAMHDTDAHAADLCNEMHRQPGEPRACRGRYRGPQQRQDLVGARNHSGGHALRIGAAAADADIGRARDFRFHIAAQPAVRRDAGFDAGEPIGLGIEPVEVTVEHAGDRRALCRRQIVDRSKRCKIAVEPANHVQRVGGKIGRAREHARGIAVIVGTDAAGRAVRLRRMQRRQGRVHSAASFNAPPQLEPCPAVQP